MMPWCFNELRIAGKATELTIFRDRAIGMAPKYAPSQFEQRMFEGAPDSNETCALEFHTLVPIPPAVLAAGFEVAGLNWEREHWGCKWGASNCICEGDPERGELIYKFETPQNSPVPWVQRVSRSFPALRFRLFSWSWEQEFMLTTIHREGRYTIEHDLRFAEQFRPWFKEFDPAKYIEKFETPTVTP